MSKHKFQVGDLAYWSAGDRSDFGIVLKAYGTPYRPRVDILWLGTDDGVIVGFRTNFGTMFTQQEWDARNEQR